MALTAWGSGVRSNWPRNAKVRAWVKFVPIRSASLRASRSVSSLRIYKAMLVYTTLFLKKQCGDFARRSGFAVENTGIKTTGLIRCDQPRVLDIAQRGGRKVDILAQDLLAEVMAKVGTLLV